jgi:hypothetical protein
MFDRAPQRKEEHKQSCLEQHSVERRKVDPISLPQRWLSEVTSADLSSNVSHNLPEQGGRNMSQSSGTAILVRNNGNRFTSLGAKASTKVAKIRQSYVTKGYDLEAEAGSKQRTVSLNAMRNCW